MEYPPASFQAMSSYSCAFLMPSILQSRVIRKGFKKTANFEPSGVLLFGFGLLSTTKKCKWQHRNVAASAVVFWLVPFWFLQSMNPQLLQAGPSMLPSEGLVDDVIAMDATTVLGSDGEILPLVEKVRGQFDVWLSDCIVCISDFSQILSDCMVCISNRCQV